MDIENLYKSQDILLFKECYAMEKIHGSSAHIGWKDGKVSFFAGGCKHESFVALFNQDALAEGFRNNIGEDPCVIFGEAYGGKMQGMSATYGKELKFIAFEVQIGESWLAVPQAEDVAKKLGIEFVHYVKISTDLTAIDAQRDADSVQAVRNGIGAGKMREGIVLRPLIEVKKNNGQRIISKHKRDEFKERQHVPQVVDATRVAVLSEAQAVADEWVVPMRLEHVLQQLPHATDMEHTKDVVQAMIADVLKESKGEIVESKDVLKAIGKKAAELWQAKVKSVLHKT